MTKAASKATSDQSAKRARSPKKGASSVDPAPSGDGRVVIEALAPSIDGGRLPAKAVAGEAFEVSADIFSDGHDKISAVVLHRAAEATEWKRTRMRFIENDRWTAAFTPDAPGRYEYTVEAWRDPFESWHSDVAKKRAAGQYIDLELIEGKGLLDEAIALADRAIKARLEEFRDAVEGVATDIAWAILDSLEMRAALFDAGLTRNLSRHAQTFGLWVDRKRAVFSSWYELFPRSASNDANRHGTFDDVIARLPYVRDMGFDVLYFPPIHPIGATNRKGRNNSLTAGEDDPGSVYAIGSSAGGHDAVHPELGTLEDFKRMAAAAAEHGLEIALDFAIQCSPDHPWIKEHPEWFEWRPDGTLKYAENPPKKYEDIVNVNFYGASLPGLWYALRDVVLFWVDAGVKIFRVDNPHTKPLPFWQWLIEEVNRRDPEVFFLAEAFTRPKMMKRLAKVGFQQSYTYFTWRDDKWDITEYIEELTGEIADYYRPNFFVNTPDINPYYLQSSGRPGFIVRSTLAAMLSSSWGVYSGFEICESEPLTGREEYLDSEKYEVRARDFEAPGNIREHITALNRIRAENPALQDFRDTVFPAAWNDNVLSFLRMTPERDNAILVLVNLDPHHAQTAAYDVPLWEFDLADDGTVAVEDLLLGHKFTLTGKVQSITLDPADRSVAIWRLSKT